MEAEQGEPPLLLLGGGDLGRVLKAQPAKRRGKRRVDAVGGVVDRRGGQRRQDERKNDRALQVTRDMAEVGAEEGDHQAELGNLGDAQRRDLSVALVEAGEIEQREDDELAGGDRGNRDANREHQDTRAARRRNAEAEADEEERDEEILDHAHLGHDLG